MIFLSFEIFSHSNLFIVKDLDEGTHTITSTAYIDGKEDLITSVTFTILVDGTFAPATDSPTTMPITAAPTAPTTLSPTQAPVPTTPAPTKAPSVQQPANVSGELRRWHKITVSFTGPETNEAAVPNPFTDYRLDVTFTNSEKSLEMVVPGYFAADGDAAETSETSGNVWQCHFLPTETGVWSYQVRFLKGTNVALQPTGSVTGTPTDFHGTTGSFTVQETDKTGRDLRGKGLLQYVGKHHLQFAGDESFFLKAGADSREYCCWLLFVPYRFHSLMFCVFLFIS